MSLAFVAGLLHLPSNMKSEWCAVGVIFTMFFECCAGFLLGAGIAAIVRGPSARKKAFLLAMGGAVLGAGAAGLVPDAGDDALALSMFAQTVGVVVILSLAGLWWALRARVHS